MECWNHPNAETGNMYAKEMRMYSRLAYYNSPVVIPVEGKSKSRKDKETKNKTKPMKEKK
jgi:hypothetical protein